MAASTGESIGKLFIELGLQDQALAPAINKAIAEADRLKTGVDKAGRTAAKAMAPFMARLQNPTPSGSAAARACAEWAYEMADAMLAERSKVPGQEPPS